VISPSEHLDCVREVRFQGANGWVFSFGQGSPPLVVKDNKSGREVRASVGSKPKIAASPSYPICRRFPDDWTLVDLGSTMLNRRCDLERVVGRSFVALSIANRSLDSAGLQEELNKCQRIAAERWRVPATDS
jgi:hypothetical protein